MITGAHTLIFSTDPEADRRFFRDVLGLPNVDVGDGWLIFGLPPAEVAVHPSDRNNVHELYLICDDIAAFIAHVAQSGIACSPIEDHPWGLLTRLGLPGGGQLGVYQPRHARPPPERINPGVTCPRKPVPRPDRLYCLAKAVDKPPILSYNEAVLR